MTRTRDHALALHRIPRGVDRLSLMVWAEWRRKRLSINDLARRTGYGRRKVSRVLR